MEKEEIQKLCDELRGMTLSRGEREEFDNISQNQPVFAGNVLSKQTSQALIDKGLAMRYEGDYVLTNKGTVLRDNIIAVTKIRDAGVFYKNQK